MESTFLGLSVYLKHSANNCFADTPQAIIELTSEFLSHGCLERMTYLTRLWNSSHIISWIILVAIIRFQT